MSRPGFFRPIPTLPEQPKQTGSKGQKTRLSLAPDGYLELALAVLQSTPIIEIKRDEGSAPKEHLASLRTATTGRLNEYWPLIWSALLKGRICGYAIVPGRGIQCIPVNSWSSLAGGEMPRTLEWGAPCIRVAPLLRVGDLEWLLADRDRPDVWTVEQALIWLCTRDLEMVERASRKLGSSWMTWPEFLLTGNFQKMEPGDALSALKGDMEAFRIEAWAGLRLVHPYFFRKAQWHRAADDRWAVMSFRIDGEGSRAVVLDMAKVIELYPRDTLDQFCLEPDGSKDEAESAGAKLIVEASEKKYGPGIVRKWCEKQLEAWMESGSEMRKRPTERLIWESAQIDMPGIGKNQVLKVWRTTRPDAFVATKGPRR